MMDFSGEYRHKADAKGRISVPSDFRKDLPQTLKVTLSLSGDYLMVFVPEDYKAWVDAMFAKDGGFDASNLKHVGQRKVMNSRVKTIELDASGRLMIPADQRERAALEKEVLVIGDTDHFEIWNPERWEEYCAGIDLMTMYS